MKKLYVLVIALFILNISITAQQYGLLLGVGYQAKCKIGEYIDAGYIQELNTLWITGENDSLKIVANIPYFINIQYI